MQHVQEKGTETDPEDGDDDEQGMIPRIDGIVGFVVGGLELFCWTCCCFSQRQVFSMIFFRVCSSR